MISFETIYEGISLIMDLLGHIFRDLFLRTRLRLFNHGAENKFKITLYYQRKLLLLWFTSNLVLNVFTYNSILNTPTCLGIITTCRSCEKLSVFIWGNNDGCLLSQKPQPPQPPRVGLPW